MAKYKIIIPSKSRGNQLYTKTIPFLRRMGVPDFSIFVFIPLGQYFEYKREGYNINLITLPDGFTLMQTLNTIHGHYLQQGEKAIRIDDDIEEMYYCPTKSSLIPIRPFQFDEMIDKAFSKLDDLGIHLAGINPTGNAFFTSNKIGKTRGSYLVGAFQIFINDRVSQLRTFNTCEDVQQICRHIKKDGYCLKLSPITIKTKWFGKGGLEEMREKNLGFMKQEHEDLQDLYQDLFTYKFQEKPMKVKFKWKHPKMFDVEEFTLATTPS
jgi:hypothetical protein